METETIPLGQGRKEQPWDVPKFEILNPETAAIATVRLPLSQVKKAYMETAEAYDQLRQKYDQLKQQTQPAETINTELSVLRRSIVSAVRQFEKQTGARINSVGISRKEVTNPTSNTTTDLITAQVDWSI